MAVQKMTENHEQLKRPTNKIALILIVITMLEILVGLIVGRTLQDTVALKQFVYIILVIFAISKAYSVVMYFMGLKYEEHKYTIAIFVIVVPLLFIMYFIMMPLFGIPSYSAR